MGSNSIATTCALLLALNLLFLTLANANYSPCPPPPPSPCPPPPKKHAPPYPHPPPSTPSPIKPSPSHPPPSTPTPIKPSPPHPPPSTPTPTPPSTPTPTPPSTPTPTPPTMATCPRDTLKLGVCGNVLSGLLNIIIGTPPNKEQCCSLISGLVDLDAAVCLCTAIKANVLGINLNIPVSLSLLLNACGKKLPSGFQCN